MTGIKVLLVSGFLAVLVWAFRNRSRAGLRAGARALSLAVATFAIIAVLFPDTTVWVAHHVGVARGADLVVYLLALVFFVLTVHTQLRFRDLEHRLTTMVRAIALGDVLSPDDDPGGASHEPT